VLVTYLCVESRDESLLLIRIHPKFINSNPLCVKMGDLKKIVLLKSACLRHRDIVTGELMFWWPIFEGVQKEKKSFPRVK